MPYQYYSGSCEKTYQKASHGFIRTGEDEQQALCTDDFSDISPLTGGNVAFSTLEGRPSAYNFDNSPVLQVNRKLLFNVSVSENGKLLKYKNNVEFWSSTGSDVTADSVQSHDFNFI